MNKRRKKQIDNFIKKYHVCQELVSIGTFGTIKVIDLFDKLLDSETKRTKVKISKLKFDEDASYKHIDGTIDWDMIKHDIKFALGEKN